MFDLYIGLYVLFPVLIGEGAGPYTVAGRRIIGKAYHGHSGNSSYFIHQHLLVGAHGIVKVGLEVYNGVFAEAHVHIDGIIDLFAHQYGSHDEYLGDHKLGYGE